MHRPPRSNLGCFFALFPLFLHYFYSNAFPLHYLRVGYFHHSQRFPDHLTHTFLSLSTSSAVVLSCALLPLVQPLVVFFARLSPTQSLFFSHSLSSSTLRTSPRLANRTLIVIAHRLNTVADADALLWLDGGRLVAFGPPQEILSRLAQEDGVETVHAGEPLDAAAAVTAPSTVVSAHLAAAAVVESATTGESHA